MVRVSHVLPQAIGRIELGGPKRGQPTRQGPKQGRQHQHQRQQAADRRAAPAAGRRRSALLAEPAPQPTGGEPTPRPTTRSGRRGPGKWPARARPGTPSARRMPISPTRLRTLPSASSAGPHGAGADHQRHQHGEQPFALLPLRPRGFAFSRSTASRASAAARLRASARANAWLLNSITCVSGNTRAISPRILPSRSAAQLHSSARMALICPCLPSSFCASGRLIQSVMSSWLPRSGLTAGDGQTAARGA